MAIVRVVLDMDVPGGKESDVVDAIFDHRKKVTDYIANVVLPNNDETSSVVATGLGLNSHPHDTRHDNCRVCIRHSREGEELASVGE